MNGDEQARDFLGTGWSFATGVNRRGGISLSSGVRDIEEAIQVILSTAKGERRMRPNFGCGIHDLVFSPLNPSTIGLIQYHVEEALGWWEPRIEVQAVEVEPDAAEASRVYVNVRYRVKATNDERNLVYPFYMIPEEV